MYGVAVPVADLNLNPPWTLLFLQPFSRLSLARFKEVWTLLSGICLLAGCLILVTQQSLLQGRQVLWLLACAPTIEMIDQGQIYAWPFLIGVLAWMNYRKGRLLAAGIAIGMIVSLRPTMGFVLLVLLLAGHRKIACASVGTILAVYAVPLLIYGPTIYVEWLHAFAGDTHWMSPINIAIMPLLARRGYPHLGVWIAAAIVIGVCWWAFRRRPDFTSASGAAFCLGILCAPLAWFLYVLFAAPFFMTRKWTLWTTSGAALLLIRSQLTEPTRGLLYLIATLTMLIFFLRSPPSSDGHVRVTGR